ncbi:hypothetical protein Cni_G25556 [Canna indica]|uniref:Uncharacterized protein n=1 Tax=Canna indica TaxID=4628 RepID=A0AAQ3QPE4_9LILI|nr:hypothetical protein Cni_G25556 [Canna indica]
MPPTIAGSKVEACFLAEERPKLECKGAFKEEVLSGFREQYCSPSSSHYSKHPMPLLYDERGPPWKQGWTQRTLSSLSLPPPHLLAVFAIVALFLSLSWYVDYKTQVRRAETGFRLVLPLLPVVLVLVARYMFDEGRVALRIPLPDQEEMRRARSSPCGVAVLVVVLLVMVSYQSSFHRRWFWPWRVD